MKATWQPARGKLLVGLLLLAAVVVVGFTALLSFDLQRVRVLDATQYTENAVENFVCEASASMQDGKIVITGWGCEAGKDIDLVENDLVLYQPSTGEYLLIPTQMQQTEAANAILGDAEDYSFGGFYGTFWPSQIEGELSDYELCISYRTNYHNALLHTGLYLEVMAE